MELEEPVEFQSRIERMQLEVPLEIALPLPSGMHALAIEDVVRSGEEPRCEELEGLCEVTAAMPHTHCWPCMSEVNDVVPEGG